MTRNPAPIVGTPADLTANRSGQLTDAQKKRLHHLYVRRSYGLFALLMGINVLTLIATLISGQTGALFRCILPALIGDSLAMFFWATWQRTRVMHDIQHHAIKKTTGTLHHSTRQDGTHTIRINRQRLIVTPRQQRHLHPETRYTVYYTERTRRLLSAEKAP